MRKNNPIITAQILQIISEIDEFKGAWKALSLIAPEKLLSLKQVATIESIGSSTRIEGVVLTDIEIEKLLRSVGKQTFASRDEQEVAGYADLMEVIFLNWETIPFTENYIKQLHKILLNIVTKMRDIEVNIRNFLTM